MDLYNRRDKELLNLMDEEKKMLDYLDKMLKKNLPRGALNLPLFNAP